MTTRIGIIGLICLFGLSLATTSLPAAQRESKFFARAPIAAWHGQRFNIVRIDTMDRFDGLRAMLENWTSSFPDQVASLQAAIRANRPLSSALQARSVQIRNVVAIQTSFSGNLIFYLR